MTAITMDDVRRLDGDHDHFDRVGDRVSHLITDLAQDIGEQPLTVAVLCLDHILIALADIDTGATCRLVMASAESLADQPGAAEGRIRAVTDLANALLTRQGVA